MLKTYKVLTSRDLTTTDDEGNPLLIKAGTAVNRIVWDGETPFDPGPGYTLLEEPLDPSTVKA